MYVRKTSNGKFSGSRWQASYCPEEQQRRRLVLAERSRAEAEGRSVAEWAQPKIWLPRDGVYASPGADFDDRCMKSGDAIVDFASKSIASGADRCEIHSHIDGTLEDPDPRVMVTRNETHDTKGTIVVRYIDGVPRVGPPGFEIMWLNRIDDKTISLRKTHDGKSSELARQVAYCSDEVQLRYREQKAGK